jgi:hypothetical protein
MSENLLDELNIRYLDSKNSNMTCEKIKFEDEGHRYWAYSKYYSEWVSTKNGKGGAPLVSTTTMLGKHFHFDIDNIAVAIWNNPKFRFLMETDTTYKYYGCTSIDDIKKIWGLGAIAGTKMHANFEDFVNLIEYDKDHPPTSGNNLTIDPIIGISAPTQLKCKVPKKEDFVIHAIASSKHYMTSEENDGDGGCYYNHVDSIKEYKFHMRNDTASYRYVESRMEGYQEKMYLFMFLEKFKILDTNSGVNFYRTEMLMWHNVLHISGMIDGLLYDKNTDSYIIVDWKRCKGGVKGDPDPNNSRTKRVEDLKPSGRGQGLPAFELLRNNNANKYGCQLTLYKKMFEHMTGKRISGMYLVVIDSEKLGKANALDIQEVPLTKFDECIRQVFENRAREMLSTFQNTLDDDHIDALIEQLPDDDDPGPSVPECELSPTHIKRKLNSNGPSLSPKKIKN